MWQVFSRILAIIENSSVALLMIFSVVMIGVQVFSRVIFSYSFSWAEESVRYSIIWMVFIGGSIAFRENLHIKVDVIKEVVPSRFHIYINTLASILCLMLCFMLMWYGVKLASQMQAFGQSSPALEAPMYIFYLSIPIGASFMLIRLFESLVNMWISYLKIESSNNMAEV